MATPSVAVGSIAPQVGRRLWQGVVLVNLILLLLAAYFLGAGRQGVLESTRRNTEQLARLVAHSIDSEFRKIDIALRLVSQDYFTHVQAGPGAVDELLREVRKQHPSLNVLSIANAEGEVIHAPDSVAPGLAKVGDRDYFQRLKVAPGAGLEITAPMVGRISGRQVIVFARRLASPDGAFVGVVLGSLPVELLATQLAALDLAAGDAVVLRDRDLRLTVRYPETGPASVAGSSQASPAFTAALSANPLWGSYVGASFFDGVERLNSYRRSEHFGFYVNVGSSLDRVLAPWWQQLQGVAFLLLLVLVLTLALVRQLRQSWQRQLDAAAVLEFNDRQLNEAQKIARLGYFSFDLRSESWEVSDTLAEIYGIDDHYRRDREGWTRILHPDDRNLVLAYLADDVVSRGLPIDCRFRIRRQDNGDIRWVQARGRFERAPLSGVPRLFGSVQDITERKQAEDQLAQSEARFRAFFDQAMIGMAITSTELKWEQVNPALCRILGYPCEVLLTKTWAELTVAEDLPANQELFEQAMRGEIDGYQMEKRFRRADGEVVHASVATQAVRSADGSIDFFSTSIEDITARVRAEEAYRRANALLEAAGRAAKFGGWSVEAESRVLTWTAETFRLHDLEPGAQAPSVAEAIAFYAPESRPIIAAAVAACLADGTPWDNELCLLTARGRSVWVRTLGKAERKDGRIVRIYGAILDIDAQRAAANALAASEKRLRLVAENAAAYIYELSCEGTIVFANRVYAQLSLDQVLGTSILDWFPADRRQPMADALRRAVEECVPQDLAYDLADPAGLVRSYESRLSPVLVDGAVCSVVLTASDVTDRRQFEVQVLNSRETLRQFIDHFPGIAYVKDEDLCLKMANASFFAQLGGTPGELIGRCNEELFPGEFGKNMSLNDRRVLASGQAEVIEEEWNGRIYETTKFVIQQQGQRQIGGITVDVSNRVRSGRRAEAELQLSALGGTLPEGDFLRAGLHTCEALTNSRIGFLHFVNDDQEAIDLAVWSDGALKVCQASFERHYPISRAGIWADCFHQRRPVVFNDYAGHQAKKGLPGGHAPLERLISVPVIEDGLVRLMIGVGNKASDYDDFDVQTVQLIGNDLWRMIRRQRAERALQDHVQTLTALNQKLAQAQNQLLQSEKMATIGQLAAGVAHELNNPIGFIQSNLGSLNGYVEDLLAIIDRGDRCAELCADSPLYADYRALKADKDLDFIREDVRQLLLESKDGADRVRRIVQNLKDFSHVSEEEWLWADLHKGLDSTLTIVWNEIKYKAEVEKRYGVLPEIFCVPSQLNQVFMNLLVNAAQAIEGQGKITLATGLEGEGEARRVWVEVRDTGNGIAVENLQRIFDPFFTTKPVGKGTGLGLSLAWSIVQKHHGTLSVDSTISVGTTFRITLPINGAEANGAVSNE